MNKITFSVTLDDCKKGIPCNSIGCPVAVALYRQGYNRVAVTAKWITINGVKYNLSEKLCKAIESFDGNGTVFTGDFELTLR